MSRLAGDMKGFVVLGVYRSTAKNQNKEKNTAMGIPDLYNVTPARFSASTVLRFKTTRNSHTTLKSRFPVHEYRFASHGVQNPKLCILYQLRELSCIILYLITNHKVFRIQTVQ